MGALLLVSILALAGASPIRLLFVAGIIAGIATPIGLIMLLLVAGNDCLMSDHPVGPGLRAAGWVLSLLVTVVSIVYLIQQLHPASR